MAASIRRGANPYRGALTDAKTMPGFSSPHDET